MSYINSYTKCIFGKTVGGDQVGRSQQGTSNQLIAEQIVATTSRKAKGPQRVGHYSYQVDVQAGSSPVGTLTVWYSNLPDPDETNDAHWVQDTTIASLDLSVVGKTFVNVGNVYAEHIRFKVTRTSGTLAVVLWLRSEGVEV